MAKPGKGDAVLHRGERYVVTSVDKVTRAVTEVDEDERKAARSQIEALRTRMVEEADDLSPNQRRELEAELQAIEVPGRGKFGCRTELLQFSDEHDAWIIPGQED